MKRVFVYIIFTLFLFSASYTAVSYYFALKFTGSHNSNIGDIPDSLKNFTENVSLKTQDSLNIKGWYMKPDTGRSAIIFLHAYGSNRLEMLPRALMFRRYGFGAFIYDARACGESEGEHVSFGAYEIFDLKAAIKFLKDKGIENIGLIGFSQGGATICMGSSHLPLEIKFAVIESTFPNLLSAIDTRFRKYFLLPGSVGGALMIPLAEDLMQMYVDDISPVRYIISINTPVLVMYGSNDSRLRREDAYKVYEESNKPKEWHEFDGAEHEDLYLYNKNEYEDVVMTFIKKYF